MTEVTKEETTKKPCDSGKQGWVHKKRGPSAEFDRVFAKLEGREFVLVVDDPSSRCSLRLSDKATVTEGAPPGVADADTLCLQLITDKNMKAQVLRLTSRAAHPASLGNCVAAQNICLLGDAIL